jgi:hypothetical protein
MAKTIDLDKVALIRGYNRNPTVLADEKLIADWKQYHAAQARLVVSCPKCNMSQGNRK